MRTFKVFVIQFVFGVALGLISNAIFEKYFQKYYREEELVERQDFLTQLLLDKTPLELLDDLKN